MSEDEIQKLVKGRPIAPRATKILYARHTYLIKELEKAGLIDRDEMNREVDAMVRDIEAKQAETLRRELGLDKPKEG
jgi:hypothetical protein